MKKRYQQGTIVESSTNYITVNSVCFLRPKSNAKLGHLEPGYFGVMSSWQNISPVIPE